MSDKDLREVARQQVEALELLEVRAEIQGEAREEAQAVLEMTREYWQRLAYPWGYEQERWYTRLLRWATSL